MNNSFHKLLIEMLQSNSSDSLAPFWNHFPGGPGLADTRMYPVWILLDVRMMEVVSGDNWSYKMCKALVK